MNKCLLNLLLIILSGITTSFAADKTWNGNTTDWNSASNWNPAILPTTTDDIIIPTSPTGGNMPTISSGSSTILSLTIQTGATLTQNGGTILVKGGGIGTISGTYNQSGGFFLIDNNMDVTINIGGQLNVSGTAVFHLAKDIGTNPSSSLVINGSVNLSGGNIDTKAFTIPTGKTITQSGGTLFVKGDVGSISGIYNQSGGYSFIDNQAVTVNSGGQLNLSGSATFHMAKDLSTAPGQTLTVNGSVTQNGGTLDANDLTIGSGASYTLSGTSLNIIGNLTNSGTVSLSSGTANVTGNIINNASANLTISGVTLTSQNNTTNYGTISISSGSFDLNTAGKKITVDGGTFNQTGGTVSTKDMELKNNGFYNQSNGEFKISHDLNVPPGNTFAATGGTVRFTGAAGGGADYRGNVQFYNVIIDAAGDFNTDDAADNIKIAGNFTNNNPNLDNDKGTFTFNGTSPQTIYSDSDPASTKTMCANLVVSNPSGVTLQTNLGLKTSFSYDSGGYLDLDENILYVNGEIYDGPLPVELSSFSAVILENGIKLKWRTETEVSNYGFEILRSAQNDRWEVIGFVEGHGNSNSPKDYSFVDENVTAGKPAYRTGRYSYRLKQIDTDGKFEYSKVIEVDLGSPMNYELSQNYPNPFNPTTTIRFSVLESSIVNLSIFNSLGEKIEELMNEVKEPGMHTIEFNAKDLPSGAYFYRIKTVNFINIKKMILIK